MNFKNFEHEIDATILKRGYEYFNLGYIVDIDQVDALNFECMVAGSQGGYDVNVMIDSTQTILLSTCSCPYDFGPVCKHEVAVYYAINELLNAPQKTKTNSKKMPQLAEILNEQTKETLVELILEITKKDKALKQSILLKYANVDDDQYLNQFKTQMKAILKPYHDINYFIHYHEAKKFVDKMYPLVHQIDDYVLAHANEVLGIKLCFSLLDEVGYASLHADDSDGYINELISEIFSRMAEFIKPINAQELAVKEQVFDLLISHLDDEFLSHWSDFEYEIYYLCEHLATEKTLAIRYLDLLKEKVKALEVKAQTEYYDKYRLENLIKRIISLLSESHQLKKRESYIQEYLHLSGIKEIYLEQLIKEKNDEAVILFAKKAQEEDKNYRGLVMKWRLVQYEAYKRLGQMENQKTLGRAIFLDGEFSLYHELKILHSNDFNGFYQGLLTDVRGKRRDLYLQLIEAEDDHFEMMDYVSERFYEIERFADKLFKVEGYLDQVIQLYIRYLEYAAENASDRNQYKSVCQLIKRFKKYGGDDLYEQLIDQFIIKYKRRRAFIEELTAIKSLPLVNS